MRARAERLPLVVTHQLSETLTFLDAVRGALADGTFVRVSLSKFRGKGEASKLVVSRVALKGGDSLRFVASAGRRETTENLSLDAGFEKLSALIGAAYHSATLFTTERDVSLNFSKKGRAQLVKSKATFIEVPSAAHDRTKQHAVSASSPYLAALGVTDAAAQIKPSMFAKFRQISRFIEIAGDLIDEAGLAGAREMSVLDIGSGKGYLTFALYDYLTAQRHAACRIRGIEVREDLASASNALATKLGFSGLSFDALPAEQVDAASTAIVIALHACDTATDDALALGIKAGARVIIASPCCQHEIAPQLRAPEQGFAAITHYPLLRQRQADLVTDAARALLLEAAGYAVKIIEFVSTEHTAKNLLIAAVKSAHVDRETAAKRYHELKTAAGFEHHALATHLKGCVSTDVN